MKNKELRYMACLLLALLAACRADDSLRQSGTGGKITLSAQIEQLYLSRVSDSGFADGDEMGVFIVDYEGSKPGTLGTTGNRADNLKYTYHESEATWTSAYDVYFRDSHTPVDIYGYYPFTSFTDVNQHAFYVQADQSTPAQGGNLSTYEQSDFLWGKVEGVQPTEESISIPLRHRLSCARITLKEGKDFGENEWAQLTKSVILRNAARNALIDLSTGSVTLQGNADAQGIIPFCSDNEFRAIVVPQTVEGGKTLFSITVGQTSYSFTKDEAFTFTSGKMHNFTITVDHKSGEGEYAFSLTDESITPWEADVASHEANAKEYLVVNVPTAGTLKKCLADGGNDYTKVQNLKLTGWINDTDFEFMRGMKSLRALNLKEVRCADDRIPSKAFDYDISAAHLYSVVLPDTLTAIGSQAFKMQALVGSLQIPEGVTKIGSAAFYECKGLAGTLTLPSTLQTIDGYAFMNCAFSGELLLPQQLKTIEDGAFANCQDFTGRLNLPAGLQKIGESAFCNTGFSDVLKIPQSASVEMGAFTSCKNFSRLVMHDGITEIGKGTFRDCYFKGELTLPKNLVSIGENAFYGDIFLSGELKLPETLMSIGQYAFYCNVSLSGTLEIPKNITSIYSYSFYGCSGVSQLVLPEKLEIIQKYAFAGCSGLKKVICNSTEPPTLASYAIEPGLKGALVVEVPEESVNAYRLASGWCDFKIVAHHELYCSSSSVAMLNMEKSRTLTLNAESGWEVTKIPSWCHLDKTSGFGTTQLTLTVDALAKGSAQRTDSICFTLKNADYTAGCAVTQYNYEYDEDAIITLQQATKGNGVNLVFLGDGFTASSIADGTYLKTIRQRVEEFFAVEPYTSYRNYFNVYTRIACSNEEGVGGDNRFGTAASDAITLKCNSSSVFNYVQQISGITKSNLPQTLIVIIPNTSCYDGNTMLWADGSAISICPESAYEYPNDTRGITQHEAGGHGFGKLGDESVIYDSYLSTCTSSTCNLSAFREAKARGWYENLSLTGKAHEVPWAHYLSLEKYNTNVDVYEGGYQHSRGVFRSEQSSCMSTRVPYFNAISREAIVKRILQYAGQTFSFDEFIKNDK